MSLILTRVLEYRAKLENYDKNMARPLEYGALDFFAQQTKLANGLVTSEFVNKVFASAGRDVKIPSIDYNEMTVSNVRSCSGVTYESTSKLTQVTFVTYAVGFSMVKAQYLSNDIAYMKDFNRKLEACARNLAVEIDKGCIAALEANKTQVFKDALTYPTTGDAIQASYDMRDEVFGDLNTMMRANAYPGMMHVIGNGGIEKVVNKQSEHGPYNDVNKQFEFQNKVLHFTTNITNESGVLGTGYAVTDGNVAVVTRAETEAFMGTKIADHEWSVVNLPYLELPVCTHFHKEVGDQSATAGDATAHLTCNVKEYFDFSIQVGYITSYNTDLAVHANPIMKIEIGTSAYPAAKPVVIVNSPTDPVNTKEVTP